MNNIHNQCIPAEVLAQVKEKLGEAIALLSPYAVTLSPDERRNMLKLGDKSSAFVEKALEFCKTNPEFVPAFMTTADLEIDVVDFKAIVGPFNLSNQLCYALEDTMMTAGSEAYYQALYYYKNVQQAADMNIPGAKVIYEELRKRFPTLTRKSDSSASAPAK